MNRSSFDKLIEGARAGDESAILEVIELCGPEIQRTAKALLGPLLRRYVDSVDVAQSVRISLLQGLRGDEFELSDPDKLIGLAVRMVERKVADNWRKVHRRKNLLDHRRLRDPLPVIRWDSGATSHSEDPAAQAALNEQFERVLNDLDPTERRLIELRAAGYSTAGAAKELGCNADILRVVLSRLRVRLRDKGLLAEWL